MTVTATTVPTGLTVTNIVNTGGTITADIAADCAATTGDNTIVLQVSDGSLTANANLIVNVSANTAPMLSYNNATVNTNGSTTVNPSSVPSDNGTISGYAVQSQGTYTGTISVNNSGVVSISSAAPTGTHTITIRATDNCGATKDATFTLEVQPLTISGAITFNTSALANVTVTLTKPDSTTTTAMTNAAGLYSFPNLVAGNYTVTPAKTNFSFTPASQAVTLSSTNATANFTAASTATASGANGAVLISEFRLQGPVPSGAPAPGNANGELDEFIELYNNSNSSVDLSGYTLDTAAGFTITIATGATIPARASYLIAHSAGYSLASYATPDQTYSGFDLPSGTGLALLNPTNQVVDAVGFTPTPTPYLEGTGLMPPAGAGQYSWVRKTIITGGVPNTGRPQDTGINSDDFVFVSTTGDSFGANAPSVLGAPGPENSTSPIQRNAQIRATLVDPLQGVAHANNRFRNATPNQAVCNGNCPLGTLSVRRSYMNNTGANIRRLRFRIVDITTLNSAGYVTCPDLNNCAQADLRALSSPDITVMRGDGSTVTVRGTTLEEPPTQGRGGGLNSSLLAGSITLEEPLAPGASLNVQFLLGVYQRGLFSLLVNVEALQ